MELRKVSFPPIPAKSNYSGSGSVEATAGQHFKIETTPNGVEVLDVVVPEGKLWKVIKIDIAIEEVDV